MAFAGASLIADGELCGLSASPIDAGADSGYHLLHIEGYWGSKVATPNGECIESRPFLVGGHHFHLEYYPNGFREEDEEFISVFLVLEDVMEGQERRQVEDHTTPRAGADAAARGWEVGGVSAREGEEDGDGRRSIRFAGNLTAGGDVLLRAAWSGGDSCCGWEGVRCDGAGGRVTALRLPARGLAGPIPGDSIAGLARLQELDLSRNALSGGVSPVATVAGLHAADLSSNLLVGSLPDFAALPGLVAFNASIARARPLRRRAGPAGARPRPLLRYRDDLHAVRVAVRGQAARVAVLGAVFCGSVVGGNVSLRYLPVSFNQAVGATTPFFTALIAYAIAARREAGATYAALVPVVVGVVIATGGEPSFHLFGFIMRVGATAGRALKTVLQGILLSSEEEKLNSMDLLRCMAPVAVVLLVPATLVLEPEAFGAAATLAREDPSFVWLLLGNSSLAYLVNLTNFLVTKHTSPLTLQVLGNAKGAVAVVVSILIFKNPVTVMGMLGYGVTIAGVILYGEAKKRSK